jgi:DNA helicase II / ATP-dependent DNA helicase PcrA
MNLTPEQQKVISHRDGDLQIVACAGSGKTEAVSRRVAALLAEGAEPRSIIAFTFTEKAGAELKERIYRRTEELAGVGILDRLGQMLVGTIHGWCFHMLQDTIPHFGNHEVLDDHRHAAFLSREARALGLKDLGGGKHWAGIREWMRLADVIGNELITPEQLDEPSMRRLYEDYVDLMERFHFLTFSRVITQAVEELEKPDIHQRVCGALRHLVVDEYQDINPAQERLIQLLSRPPVQLCVVGDDDQAIYQWRGADVRNIVSISRRRERVDVVSLLDNRRSRPLIVETSARFALSIPDRLPKTMRTNRPAAGPMLFTWSAATDVAEAETVADTVQALSGRGYRYQDIAVLLRSVRTSAKPLFDAMERRGIPVSCGGRTGLFVQPEIDAIGRVYALLAGFTEWKATPYAPAEAISAGSVAGLVAQCFPGGRTADQVAGYITDWISFTERHGSRPVDLVNDYYRFLLFLKAQDLLDPDTPRGSSLLGSLARFSQLLADFEHVTRRGRYQDGANGREFVQGSDRGKGFWFGLGNYLTHYAVGAYEDFEGETALEVDAVQVLTVHQAKGLEWPVVFLPSLVEGRFPARQTGAREEWPFSEQAFPQEKRDRYAGSDADERRLFYTAMTRARDMLYCSCFHKKTREFKASPYLLEIAGTDKIEGRKTLPLPEPMEPTAHREPPPQEISFSDMAGWVDCGYAYRLSSVFGFQRWLAEELGYGKAVHHVLRSLAEMARTVSGIPSRAEVHQMVEREFYTPFATSARHDQLFRSALGLVDTYLEDYTDDLHRIWEIERPFELHTPDGLLTGRADVILDREGGGPGSLAIIDYKVSRDDSQLDRHELQLRIYSHAGRQEGFDVRAAYLHSLAQSRRQAIGLSDPVVSQSVETASKALAGIRRSSFPPVSIKKKCEKCDYRHLCRHCSNEVRAALEEWG